MIAARCKKCQNIGCNNDTFLCNSWSDEKRKEYVQQYKNPAKEVEKKSNIVSFETFKKILDLQAEHYQKEQTLYELGVDTINLNEPLVGAISMLWSEVLTESGDDWLSFWLYDKYAISGMPDESIKAFDGDVEILKSVEELYDYLVSNSYFRAKND